MDTSSLLEHLDWVRALAHRLVTDQNVADDLIQEAWLAAERSAPIHPRAARGWFASVLRRKAAERCRVEGNRRDRELRVARSESAPSDAKLRDSLDVEAQVSRAVRGLDEPFRRTILLRYFEEMTPTEIAASEGIPLNTVKSRLTRGHAALRQRLDAEHGGDGRAWVLALIPIARSPAVVRAAGGAAAWGGSLAALVAACLLAVCGIALGWISQRGPKSPVDIDGPEPHQAIAQPEGTQLAGVAPRTRATVVPGEAVGRTPLPPTRDETLVIRFVDRTTGEPARGAAAWVIDADRQSDPAFAISASEIDSAALCKRFGSRVVANEQGVASVAWSGQGAIIMAVDGAWFGERSLNAKSAGDVEVLVFPSTPLAVHVVDAQGEDVAGIRVGLMVGGTRGVLKGGRTNPGGDVTVPFFGGLLENERNRGAEPLCRVTLVYPGSTDLAGVPVVIGSAHESPGEPVVVVRPPVGEVELIAPTDLDEPELVALYPQPRGGAPLVPDASRRPRFVSPSVIWFEGRRKARTVCALGKSYVVAWSADGETRQMTFVGPKTPDESITVRIVAGNADAGAVPLSGNAEALLRNTAEQASKVTLSGRLVDGMGQPLRRVRYEAHIRSEGSSSRSSRDTDRKGRFAVQMPGRRASANEVRIHISVKRHPRGAHAVLRPGASALEGVVALGDVVVEPDGRLVSGVVRGSDGAPIGSALVDVEFEVEYSHLPPEAPDVYWRSSDDVSGRSLKDGTFEVFAPPLDFLSRQRESMTGRIRARATKNREATERVDATPGGSVELKLLRTADIELTFAEAGGGIASGLSAVLVRPVTGERRGPFVDGGAYTWRGVLPGSYDITLLHDQFKKKPLLELTGIEVTSTGCHDERLVGMNLSAFVTTNVVRVETHAGEPAEGVAVWVHREDGSNGAGATWTDERGEATVLSRPGNPRRIRVGALDWDEEPTLLLQDLVVELPRSIEIKVRLVTSDGLSIGNDVLGVRAKSEDLGSRPVDPAGPASEDGWLTFELKGVGAYSFEWVLMGSSSISTRVRRSRHRGQVIEVIEDGQRIELPVPEDVLAEARSRR